MAITPEKPGRKASSWALILAAGLAISSLLAPAQAAPAPAKSSLSFYEMRTYYANPGKLETLKTRFRDHALRLFDKHGMTKVGFWLKEDGGDGVLVYILAYPSKAARDASWVAFRADPEWQAAAAASEVDGKLLAKVESVFMTMADFSPHPTTESGVLLK
ncbi:NIPSNAP family protein [Glacieibacterium sp.]|uniref:NIPSNAP family protein n=1 Tax=Glacieibacterium sp. TaxID=2860237 RepID=UPI003B001E20